MECKDEIGMTECDFDKNAEAVVLFDIEDIKCSIYTFCTGMPLHDDTVYAGIC